MQQVSLLRASGRAGAAGTSASAWSDWEVQGSDSCLERRCTEGRVGSEAAVEGPAAAVLGSGFFSRPQLRLERRRGCGMPSGRRSAERQEERESLEVCEMVVMRPPRHVRVLCLRVRPLLSCTTNTERYLHEASVIALLLMALPPGL